VIPAFAPQPDSGRRFHDRYRIRLGDTTPDGVVRFDAIARYLQDIATDDWQATGVVSDDIWVVRRTAIRVADGELRPTYLDDIDVVTWCAGSGAAWAERRTDISVGGRVRIEASAMWVPINRDGVPMRMRESFFEAYGELARTKTSSRVPHVPLEADATRRSWPLRLSDFDVVNHLNNAAAWEALSESAPQSRAMTVVHLGQVEPHEVVEMAATETAAWLLVDGEVRVVATFN
jgi:acyl-ACP thioesterase